MFSHAILFNCHSSCTHKHFDYLLRDRNKTEKWMFSVMHTVVFLCTWRDERNGRNVLMNESLASQGRIACCAVNRRCVSAASVLTLSFFATEARRTCVHTSWCILQFSFFTSLHVSFRRWQSWLLLGSFEIVDFISDYKSLNYVYSWICYLLKSVRFNTFIELTGKTTFSLNDVNEHKSLSQHLSNDKCILQVCLTWF